MGIKLRTIYISDVVSKNIMIEMAAHVLEDSGTKKLKWIAHIITKDTYENQEKEINNLPNVILYTSDYEILYGLAYGYLRGMDVTIRECGSGTSTEMTILYLYSS